MNAAEYRAAIATLGMSQRRAARFFEAGVATGERWANEGPPAAIGMWLNFMIVLRILPAWVDWVLGRTAAAAEE
jgi:hypothetical protein